MTDKTDRCTERFQQLEADIERERAAAHNTGMERAAKIAESTINVKGGIGESVNLWRHHGNKQIAEAIRAALAKPGPAPVVPEATATATSGERESAWVIECNGRYWDGRGPDTFVVSHLDALRFQRAEDAERAWHWLIKESLRGECGVHEHVWLARAAAPEQEGK